MKYRLLDRKVNLFEIQLLVELINLKAHKKPLRIDYATLARGIDSSSTTARSYLRALKQVGFIQIDVRQGKYVKMNSILVTEQGVKEIEFMYNVFKEALGIN